MEPLQTAGPVTQESDAVNLTSLLDIAPKASSEFDSCFFHLNTSPSQTHTGKKTKPGASITV